MSFTHWLQTCDTALVVHTTAWLRQEQAGGHRSRKLGTGFRLRHHDIYRPGDKRQHIDWKASRKSDALLVRRFAAPKRLDVHVACDVSASMLFGHKRAKLRIAVDCAGLLALAALRQGNAFGLTLFASNVVAHFPPRQRQGAILHALEYLWHYAPRVTCNTETQLAPVVSHIPMHRPALVCVISDFRMADWQPALHQLSAVHDTLIVCVEDEAETHLAHLGGSIAVRDLESGDVFPLDIPSVITRRRLQAQMETERQARHRDLQHICGAEYITATPTTDYAGDLFRLWFIRSAMTHT